ncbi:CCA-adding protein [Vairimorpha necatrix]|uniref:CCA-adding protein n=1 Tax=Vairimorpha necatrix TaxID=6039 RepID=A0AAX4J948_9MICR
MNFDISKEEQEVFDMILSCRPSNVIPRVAGGWVRDKLMGITSYDLDIALQNISGYNFALILESSFKSSVSKVNLIKSNPEKSKHLETSVCSVNGLLIDFVNLRSETYSISRIPSIKEGSPEEDAFRRDLTINSLFYNLISKEIEDFTGRGLKDIRNRLLDTPLDPYKTFEDDPLRILRLFRFHSKLDFSISPRVIDSLNYAELKNHLRNKVSKERVNIEIFKILDSKYAYKGIYDMVRYQYTEAVFNIKIIEEEYFIHLMRGNWLYNLYIIFLKTSCQLILNDDHNKSYYNEDDKSVKQSDGNKSQSGLFLNFEFLNVIISKFNLCCSSKILKIIRQIEEGLFLCKYLDFNNFSDFNIHFICLILGEYHKDILYFEYLKNKEEKVNKFLINLINKTSVIFEKPKIEIKDLDLRLQIEKKFIKYFVKEIKIYQIVYPEEDVMEYLKKNKEEIIKKYLRLEIPYKMNT